MIYEKTADIDLIQLIRQDDRRAYAELYNRYAALMLKHVYHRLHCREDAQDIVQEFFTMLWMKRKELSAIKNFSGFIYKSVRNSTLNKIAHQEVTDKYLVSMISFAKDGVPVADHLIREKQFTELIEQEVANLSPKMREVFELSRNEYLSHHAIATKLGISEQTVSKHITNALRILRNKLTSLALLSFLLH